MITLPTEKVQARADNPHFMVLFGKPKSGKTTIVASLENNLIIDLEGGSRYMNALAIQARTIDDLANIVNALREEMKKQGKFPYKYITIDSGTVLEDIARGYALKLYQKTPMAKKKDGSIYNEDILNLPNGGGYLWLRTAFEKLYSLFFDLAEHIILICHCKDRLVNETGEEKTEMLMDLSGKIGRIVSAKADAIGYVYRKKNQTIVDFVAGNDIICGARPAHLKEKQFVVAESDDNNNLTINWSEIYLPEENI